MDAAFQAYAVKVVYLWGVSGSGKTHLARAFGAAQAARGPIALSMSALAEATPEWLATVMPEGTYVLDDVDSPRTPNDAAQTNLFNLINALDAAKGGVVLVTGHAAPRDLPLRPELSSRLGSGLVFHLQPLSDDEKSAALHAHANGRGFRLPDDVIAYLLRHSRRDMASLMATLDALDQYSMETAREITLPLLRTLMQSRAQPSLI